MLKAKIIQNSVVKNEAEFSNEAQIDIWKTQFDLIPKQVYDFDLYKFGFDKDNMPPEIAFEEVTSVDGATFKIYTIPPSCAIEIEDITVEFQQRQEQQESVESFALVNELKSYIRWLNKKKIREGIWTNETFVAFLTSSAIAQAERALNQASWSTYKGLVLSAAAFYTAGEMAFIIGKVERHEQKWQSVLGG